MVYFLSFSGKLCMLGVCFIITLENGAVVKLNLHMGMHGNFILVITILVTCNFYMRG